MKIFIIVLLSFSILPKAIDANQAIEVNLPVSNLIAKMSKSVLHVEGVSEKGAFSASAVVIMTGVDETIFLTAAHVVKPALVMGVVFNGTTYAMRESTIIKGTDAAWFKTGRIPGVVALGMNLGSSSNSIPSMAFGYWGRAGQLCELSGTIGRTCRKVIDRVYSDGATLHGMVGCSHLVYYGFSGGVVVDENLCIIGINSILNNNYSLSVDIRYIWNHLPWSNIKATMEVDDNFDFFGSKMNGITRLKLDINSTINGESINDITNRCYLELNNSSQSFSVEFIREFINTKITIGTKTYAIIGGIVRGRNKISLTIEQSGDSRAYVNIQGEGFEIILFVHE